MIGKANGLGGRRGLVRFLSSIALTKMVETSHIRKNMI
jgi:hypothetical protein